MNSLKKIKSDNVDLVTNNDSLGKNRLLIEELWESVLREECPQDQAERLIQLKELSYSNPVDEHTSKKFNMKYLLQPIYKVLEEGNQSMKWINQYEEGFSIEKIMKISIDEMIKIEEEYI